MYDVPVSKLQNRESCNCIQSDVFCYQGLAGRSNDSNVWCWEWSKLYIRVGEPCSDSFTIVHRQTCDDVGMYVVHQGERCIETGDRLHLLLRAEQKPKHFQSIQTMNNREDLRCAT